MAITVGSESCRLKFLHLVGQVGQAVSPASAYRAARVASGFLVLLMIAGSLAAQDRPIIYPPGFSPRPLPPAQPPAQPPKPAPAPNAAAPQPAQTAPAQPATPTPQATVYGGLSLNNASLTEVIDLLARQLKINYILDPRVKGGVILNTYGETKDIDTRSLLETILRINGFGMVKQGDLYRIVPLSEISHLPIHPEVDAKDIPEDDRTMLNLVFLKYVGVEELFKILEPFIGENSRMYFYAPANLLFLLDSRRNMKRTMELVTLFDSDVLANQRVRLFEVKNGRPTDLAKEMEQIAKSISLSEKNAPIKFLPIDRINTIVAVSANPGAFVEVEKWLKKLDVPVQITAGAVDNYVYRVKYGQALTIGQSITLLYGGQPYGGYGGGGYGGLGGGGYPGGGAYPGGGYPGGGYPGGGGYSGAYSTPLGVPVNAPIGGAPAGTGAAPTIGPNGLPVPGAAATPFDQTGNYLANPNYGATGRIPRIIPNPLDNTLLIQATPQEYAGILNLLKQLDIPPRQVLIEARIYEVDLQGAFSSGVTAYLQKTAAASTTPGAPGSASSFPHQFLSSLVGPATQLSAGTMVGRSRELLAAVALQETQSKAKVISAPSIIATDSIPASINVGEEVPTLTAQAVTGVQVGGSSAFANSISSRATGVTLNIVARVNPSGIVTLVINQQVSSPIPAASGGIQSPSFQNRSVQTQVTVQDGDTIAIGGIMDEAKTYTTEGIPGLNRIPLLGALFGSRSYGTTRTELIVFMTPHVIYDTNQISDASDELKSRIKMLRKIVKE